jgi:hypothetical protein
MRKLFPFIAEPERAMVTTNSTASTSMAEFVTRHTRQNCVYFNRRKARHTERLPSARSILPQSTHTVLSDAPALALLQSACSASLMR